MLLVTIETRRGRSRLTPHGDCSRFLAGFRLRPAAVSSPPHRPMYASDKSRLSHSSCDHLLHHASSEPKMKQRTARIPLFTWSACAAGVVGGDDRRLRTTSQFGSSIPGEHFFVPSDRFCCYFFPTSDLSCTQSCITRPSEQIC